MKATTLRLATLFLLLAPLAALRAGDDEPIVGAIRWDGCYGDGTVTKAVEASLGQPKYHFRLPWFAQLQSDAEQCGLIRRERWEKWQELRVPSITFASAGWDTRPRNERPPFWLKQE